MIDFVAVIVGNGKTDSAARESIRKHHRQIGSADKESDQLERKTKQECEKSWEAKHPETLSSH